MNPANEAIVSVAWTQLWQVTLLAAIVGLVARVACRRKPHLAYLLWLVVLVKCITPPLWSSPLGVFSWASRTMTFSEPPVDVAPRVIVAERSSGEADTTAVQSAEVVLPDLPSPVVPEVNEAATTSPAAVRPLSLADLVLTSVAIAWLLGALAYFTWATIAVMLCRRAIRANRVPARAGLAESVEELSTRLGLRRRVGLVVVEGPIGPLTFGWLRPQIVLPASLADKPAAELEPILAHELTHVRRGDALAGLLQVISQGLWWFHPLIWWANRNLSAERERCCDEEVIASLGYEPARYGRCLLDVLELKRQRRLPAVVPGIRPFEITRQRLEHLVSNCQFFRRRMPRRYWVALAVMLAVVLPGAGLIRQQQVAAAGGPAEASTWSVAGRVVDHLGKPVAEADVLLLGPERIFVEAKKRTYFELSSPNDKSKWPKSVKTDARGQFSIERSGEDLDRLAVIGGNPVFWPVPRGDLPAGKPVEIKLPAPGSIAIECDLPGKPAKQEIFIKLRTVDDKKWDVDEVRYHFATSFAKNPGTTVFENLTPGKYAVERNQSTKLDNSIGISFADRNFVTVEPGREAKVRIDRKVGRPLTGYVRGLEKADLRYANVSIHYFGPEEHRNKDGKPVRFLTVFDVIPIESDGKFTTDPIPPGKYEVMGSAQLASSSKQSFASDFEIRGSFTVPAEGEMPTVEIKARPQRGRKQSAEPKPSAEPKQPMLSVVDEAGQPVDRFEIKAWSGDAGSSPWYNGSGGRVPQSQPLWGFEKSAGLYLTVRAEGFASKLVHFAGEELEKLRRGEAKVSLQRGEEVHLRFKLPEGMAWPADYLPDVYFALLASNVRILWSPENRRHYADTEMPDLNMLGARLTAPGEVTLRLAPGADPIHVGIYAPGFLRYFNRGPLTLESFRGGELTLEVPKPATLEVKFDRGSHQDKRLLFENASINVIWLIPDGDGSALRLGRTPDSEEPKLLETDLAPGNYQATVFTIPKPTSLDLSDEPGRLPTNPGRFSASQNVALTAGAAERVKFDYVPYDAEAWRGKRTAVVKILKADGSPAGGRKLEISWFDGHYGNLPVFSGEVPDNGQIVLEGVSDRQHSATPHGEFTVTADRLERVGTFGFAGNDGREEFSFRLPPAVGEVVPDVELVNVDSGTTIRLSDHRGKLVCLEFWASWCGPCREPLEKLNALAGAKREEWKDRVAILPISIDERGEVASEHLKSRGYSNLQPLWASGEAGSTRWESSAAKAFGIGGVPTSLLIDRDGRLLWRGHPAAGPDKKDLAARLEEAVGE